MSDPTITCPNCKTEIKLTESLAAPLIQATRQRYEQKIAQREADFGKRETALREQQEAIDRAREAIDDQVGAKLAAEREKVATDEGKKARLMVAADLAQKTREVVDLQEILKERDAKLADAQQSQADL